MAFQMPTFLTRLIRPFSAATHMSLQADALAAMNFPPNSRRAIVAGGCFWGLEELYRKHWDGKGLLDCRVGYTGGHSQAHDYHTVCTGSTGHAESLLVVFDPDRVSYAQLIEFFFDMHDPTTLNRQGADTGTQYRSAVFVEDDEQLKIAEEIKKKVGEQWYPGKRITTEIRKATQWYDAEELHQRYLEKAHAIEPDSGYHCPAHRVRGHAKLQ